MHIAIAIIEKYDPKTLKIQNENKKKYTLFEGRRAETTGEVSVSP